MTRGFLGRVWAPANNGLRAVGEIGKEVSSTIGNVFSRGVTGVRRVGLTATSRVNAGLGKLVGSRKKHGGGRRNRTATRKNRSRKNRSRKNRSRKNRH
jgi:hypothetical protein